MSWIIDTVARSAWNGRHLLCRRAVGSALALFLSAAAHAQAARGSVVLADSTTPARTSRAIVEFATYQAGGVPLAGVTLDVTASDGATHTVVTADGGRALLPDLVPGLIRVLARRIGMKPGTVAATVEAGRNTVPIILSDVIAPLLDTVRVVGGERVSARLDEFNTRYLRHEATASFSRDDITKVHAVDTWQVLSRAQGVKLMPNGPTGGKFAVSSRGMKLSHGGSVPCFMSVMVDGVILHGARPGEPLDLRDLPSPNDTHGIEVFAGGASIPLKYGGASGEDKSCGMIAVWTR